MAIIIIKIYNKLINKINNNTHKPINKKKLIKI